MGEEIEEERQQKEQVLSQAAMALALLCLFPGGGGAVGKGITLLRPAPLWVPRENNLGLAALQSPGANTCHLKSHPTRW